MSKKVIIVGGHGKVSLRLARLLSPSHTVVSIIRDASQSPAIQETGATPLVISLEAATVQEFTNTFQGQDVLYFSAGAGGTGGEERTKAVDYDGAVKVYDAIEAVEGQKPRLILVSGVDVRNPDIIPAHYTEADKQVSQRVRGHIATWFKWKYEGDKNLVARNTFKWTILRPGGLTDAPGTGKAAIGRTSITQTVTRDDVAQVLALLVDREDAAGLAIDLAGGDIPLEEGLDAMIRKGETDFFG